MSEQDLISVLEPVAAPASLWYRVEAALDPPAPGRPWAPRLAFALLVMVVAGGGAWFELRVPPLATAALQMHREFGLHPERLDVLQNEPTLLRGWIASRTALHVALADRPQPDPGGFVLSGARLLRGGRAAIFYRIGGEPATLLVERASNQRKKITYARESSGAAVVTWQAQGQAYALVSETPQAVDRACVACHLNPTRVMTSNRRAVENTLINSRKPAKEQRRSSPLQSTFRVILVVSEG